jgi:hypothetical protein
VGRLVQLAFCLSLFACDAVVFAQEAAVVVPVQVAEKVVAKKPEPPEWVVKALASVESLPTVGPIISKGIQYMGILGTIMTLLAAFVVGVIRALAPFIASAKGQAVEEFVEKAMESKLVYWLSYFSFLNAKKPDDRIL